MRTFLIPKTNKGTHHRSPCYTGKLSERKIAKNYLTSKISLAVFLLGKQALKGFLNEKCFIRFLLFFRRPPAF